MESITTNQNELITEANKILESDLKSLTIIKLLNMWSKISNLVSKLDHMENSNLVMNLNKLKSSIVDKITEKNLVLRAFSSIKKRFKEISVQGPTPPDLI